MNTIYQRNVEALSQRYPALARWMVEMPESGRYQVVGNPPNLKDGNGFVYYRDADPLQDAKEEIKRLRLKNTRLAVFLGFGLGYLPVYYAKHLSQDQQTTHFLIIERDPEIFRYALQVVDITAFIKTPQVEFMVGIPLNNLFSLLCHYMEKYSRFMFTKCLRPVYHPAALELHGDYYLEAMGILRTATIDRLMNFGDAPADSLLGVHHMLENLREIVDHPGINLLKNVFANRPAFVVASGPSLDKNIHLLKGMASRAVILTADASLRRLLDYGIKPHLVTALERSEPTITVLSGFSAEELSDTYLAACPIVRPEVYERYPGKRIVVYRAYDHFKWLGIERGMMEIKQSSGNMAFKVAEYLGCNPIILVGQDLAYSREGTSHFSGAVLGDQQVPEASQDVDHSEGMVMGVDGQPVRTTTMWVKCLRAYELDLSTYPGTCIDATEGGALINGTTVMPLQEAIDRYIGEEFNPLGTIRQGVGTFSSGNDGALVLELCKTTLQDMDALIDLFEQGLSAVKKHHDYLKDGARDNARLGEVQQEIMGPKMRVTEYGSTWQLFLMHTLQSFNIRFEMDAMTARDKHDNEADALAAVLISQKLWYTMVGDLVMLCREQLQRAKNKLEV